MGGDSRKAKAPPLPAPTETESMTTPTEVATATDVSRPGDDRSSYSLPEDGTPVTIRTRGHSANRSQTSLLIEYFEGGKVTASAGGSASKTHGDRRPSVRVRLTPSKSRKSDHIQITETRSSSGGRKASLSRRSAPQPPSAVRADTDLYSTLSGDAELEGDAKSMNSYASATEESNVSRNPIDIEIDRSGHSRRRRPASPLIPAADAGHASYQPGNMSDISAIPTDSFLDGYGPPTRTPEGKRSKSPSRAADALTAAADGLRSKGRGEERERLAIPKPRDRERSERRQKPSKSSPGSAGGDRYDDGKSSRRRSSKTHQDSVLSGADSSVLSSVVSGSHRSLDQHSVRSGASKTSINNPKLLETVEDAIRRLILPELDALKRENSKRDAKRRDSAASSGTSASREDYGRERRRSGADAGRVGDRRDREARHDVVESPVQSIGQESVESYDHTDDTPRRSGDRLKEAAAAAALGGLGAAVLHEASGGAREQRRRRRAELKSRSAGAYAEDEYEDSELHVPAPPMPLMSEINPSELTRTSILSAESAMEGGDRPHSASEEHTPVREPPREVGSAGSSSPTPTRTASLQALGTQHANVSHGDLRTLPRRRTGEYAHEYEADEYGNKIPMRPREPYEEDGYDDDVEHGPAGDAPLYGDEPGYDYYNTQDVPPPLKYVPYQPERRGLSPIPSVSGYTEGGSEVQPRDSQITHTTGSFSSPERSPRLDRGLHSPNSAPSNAASREFDHDEYRHTAYTEDSELSRTAPGQAVRGPGANPNFVHTPVGVESAVASLVDGSMLDESVLTGESGRGGAQYGNRGSMATLEEEEQQQPYYDHESPGKRSVESGPQRDAVGERGETPPSRASRTNESHEYVEEYDLDNFGRKVPNSRYRDSPTFSEAAITGAAVGAAAAALRAAQDRRRQPAAGEAAEDGSGGFEPAGVQRNKSFKERTMDGHRPANTPTHSVDRLVYGHDQQPRMGASGIPDASDPMPEVGYYDDEDLQTNPSVLDGDLDNARDAVREHWAGKTAPAHEEEEEQEEDEDEEEEEHEHVGQRDLGGARYEEDGTHGLGIGEAAGAAAAIATAAALASSHSRQPSQEQDEEWQRTSDDRKRDTLLTNPYEGASPIALPNLDDNLLGGAAAAFGAVPYAVDAGARSPLGHKIDEGYISQGPNKTPDVQDVKGKGVEFGQPPNMAGGMEDPFYTPKHTRHMSGMSQGMGSPLYDGATGAGIDRIESRDIVALMQHLMVRDAQRSARDTEILVTLVRAAAEMRNSFDEIKKMLVDTEDVIITEVKENTEKTVKSAIGGPRPFPGSGARSLQAGGSQAGVSLGTDDGQAKKANLFRRALKGLSNRGTSDLGRIEDMLNQLLTEVDVLKAQTAPGGSGSNQANPSYENLQPEGQYEQDRGYEPEGNAGTSTASHASQSGHLSLPSARSGAKPGYDRKFSDHRISTVPEANEDDFDDRDVEMDDNDDPYGNPDMLMSPAIDARRGGSVPLATPPQPMPGTQQASLSNENTPNTDRGKKQKSNGSSGWLPKISRWSETTTSSMGRVFRSSGTSKKDHDSEGVGDGPSRSGSDLAAAAAYDDYGHTADPYGDDKLHSGFSQPDLMQDGAGRQQRLQQSGGSATPVQQQQQQQQQELEQQYGGPQGSSAYVTPEDPKYKAHRNSLNLQHPQPRTGQRFQAALESQAHTFDNMDSPRSPQWAGSATSLGRFPTAAGGHHQQQSSGGGGGQGGQEYWPPSPAGPPGSAGGPPRPPKEPVDEQAPLRSSSSSRYGGGAGAGGHGGSPRFENRNLSGALGMPSRRPSGPRAMTPRSMGSAGDEAEAEARRRKRDTFGTVGSQESETF